LTPVASLVSIHHF